MYTEEQLTEAVVAIVSGFESPLKSGSMFLPTACTHVAAKCWTNNRPEDEHTTLIRQALQDLNTIGHFNYPPAGTT